METPKEHKKRKLDEWSNEMAEKDISPKAMQALLAFATVIAAMMVVGGLGTWTLRVTSVVAALALLSSQVRETLGALLQGGFF